MRNISLFSGLVAYMLILLSFNTKPTRSTHAQLTTDTDTLYFCVGDGKTDLPDNNQIYLGEDDPFASHCSVHITTSQSISDPCGGIVTYDVTIYPFSGTNGIDVVKGRQAQLDITNEVVLSFDTRDNDLPLDHEITTSGLPYTSKFCDSGPDFIGYHLLEWKISNTCGDTSVFSYILRIDDCYKPVLQCAGLSSVVLPHSGSVTIWAHDFQSSTLEDCALNNALLFSFNGDVYEPSRVFDCAAIEANDGPSFLVEIWVADDGNDQNCNGFIQPLGIEWNERNKDSCSTFIVIDDYEGACDSLNEKFRIRRPGGAGVEGVRVDFVDPSDGDIFWHGFTDDDGNYADDFHFINPLISMDIIPSKNDDPKNGVSTLDIVKLQKHLLGIELLDNPYEIIAANANNSASLSVLDLVDIRKLILGLTPDFPNNQSWRFVHKAFIFPDPLHPWVYPEKTNTHPIESFNGNFIGVKIGDITGNANGLTNDPTRAAVESLKLLINDRRVKAGERITIPVFQKTQDELLGFQFTLETKQLEYQSVQPGILNVTDDCIGVHDDAIALSWSSALPVSVGEDALFTLNFVVRSSGSLHDMLAISSEITKAEGYEPAPHSQEVDVSLLDVQLDFLSSGSDTLVFCTALGNAELPWNNQLYVDLTDPTVSSCMAHIWMSRDITDPCGGSLTYDVRIFINDGAEAVQVIEPTTVQLDANDHAVLNLDTRHSSLPDVHPVALFGIPFTVSSCLGGSDKLHRMIWRVANTCGDTIVYEDLFSVVDCTPPISDVFGLSSLILPSSGSVGLFAYDFAGSALDDCSQSDSLLYSFSGTEFLSMRTFGCQDICDNGPAVLIKIWIADGGSDIDCDGSIEWLERNITSDSTYLIIDDNEGICECFTTGTGRITTTKGEGIAGVSVDLKDNDVIVEHTKTNSDGYYEFINPILGLDVVPSKNDDPKNGVSTLDLVKIQKHLIGTDLFDTVYQYIAADANNSESVSALDMIEIRKLILGLTPNFPKNQSWRFFHESHVFSNPVAPWPFTESVEFHVDSFNGNFIGIKIGDVNGNAVVNATQVLERSTEDHIELRVHNRNVSRGDVISVPIFSDGKSILGFQYTLEANGLEYTSIEAGQYRITEESIGRHDGAITLSWYDLYPKRFDPDRSLFTLYFRSTTEGDLSDMLSLTSRITKAEAYPSLYGVSEPSIASIDLQFYPITSTTSEFALYQNEPNPFGEQTIIGFDLPAAMSVTLTIYDIHGRLIRKINGDYAQGYNEIVLKGTDLKTTGIYYYHLTAGNFTASKKLIYSTE